MTLAGLAVRALFLFRFLGKNSAGKTSFWVFLQQDQLPYNDQITPSPITWVENRCIHTFPRLFALCEIQIASFRIQTWAAESTSYDDDRYATSALMMMIIYIFLLVSDPNICCNECSR